MALFLFLGPKPRGLNFAEIYARGGRGLQRPTFRDLIPPWEHSPSGPDRGGTAPFRAGRSPGHRKLCRGGGRGARRAGADAIGGTRGAGPTARAGPDGGAGALGAETGPCGRSGAGIGRLPGAGRRGGVWAKRGQIRAGAGGAGRRRWALRHSTLSPAACVGFGAHPSGASTAARRKSPFSLYKEARRSSGFSLSNQSCSEPITLCFRSGCFFGGAE